MKDAARMILGVPSPFVINVVRRSSTGMGHRSMLSNGTHPIDNKRRTLDSGLMLSSPLLSILAFQSDPVMSVPNAFRRVTLPASRQCVPGAACSQPEFPTQTIK
jgi:hypothetical protein